MSCSCPRRSCWLHSRPVDSAARLLPYLGAPRRGCIRDHRDSAVRLHPRSRGFAALHLSDPRDSAVRLHPRSRGSAARLLPDSRDSVVRLLSEPEAPLRGPTCDPRAPRRGSFPGPGSAARFVPRSRAPLRGCTPDPWAPRRCSIPDPGGGCEPFPDQGPGALGHWFRCRTFFIREVILLDTTSIL